MKKFRPFPWRYLKTVLDTRDLVVFDAAMEGAKEDFAARASPCPGCGTPPRRLTWIPVETADETWGRGEGRSGFVTCCMSCRRQIDFFVDEELTRLEDELRAIGESSQE